MTWFGPKQTWCIQRGQCVWNTATPHVRSWGLATFSYQLVGVRLQRRFT